METSDLQTTILTDLPNEAKKAMDTFHSMVLDFFDAKDTNQLTTKFQEQANSYSTQMTTLLGTFTEQVIIYKHIFRFIYNHFIILYNLIIMYITFIYIG